MSDLLNVFLAIASMDAERTLTIQTEHTPSFLSARLSRHTENLDCSSDWKLDPIASLQEVSGDYPCTIIFLTCLLCDTTPNYGEFNYGFHPNPDAEGLNACSSPKLEERKAIIMIIISLKFSFLFHLP